MAVGETAKLIASLELKDKFSPTVGKVTKSLGTLDSRIDRSSSKATQFGQHLGIGIQNAAKITAIGVGLVATNVALGLNSLVKLEKAQAQTAAAIKSTGAVAGITAEQIGQLSEKYESMNATIGDETIREAQNLLLSFTNIRKKAFEPTLQAALDMNTRLGKGPDGLAGTIKTLGIALNDPTKGLSRLTRAGVTFTAKQIERIKALQKEGKLYEAQTVILDELNKKYGGAFAAEGGTTGAKVAKFRDAIEDLQRTLAAGFLPVVSKVADKLSLLFQDKKVIKAVEDFGTSLAGLFSDENLKTGADVLGSLFRTAQEVAPAIAAAASVTGQVVKTAVAAFTALPKELQTLLVGGLAVNKLTGGLVTNLAGGLISSVLKQLVSGVVNVNGGVVNVVGGGGLPGVGGGKTGGLGAVGKVVSGGIIIGGVALAAESINQIAEANAAAADRGLNSAEIAAQHYYGASLADQSTIAKRLGYIPTKADFQSGNAKLKGAVDRSTAKVEGMRALMGTKLERVSSNTIEAGLKAKNATLEAKAQAVSAAGIQQALLLAGLATTRVTASNIQGSVRNVAPPIVSALRSMPTPQTFVTVNVSATHVTKSTTIQKRYGPGNGSSGQNQRSGELEY